MKSSLSRSARAFTCFATVLLVLLFALPAAASSKVRETKVSPRGVLKPVVSMAKLVFSPGQAFAAAVATAPEAPKLTDAPVAEAPAPVTAAPEQAVATADDVDFVEEHSSLWLDNDSKVCLNYDFDNDQGNTMMVMLKSRF